MTSEKEPTCLPFFLLPQGGFSALVKSLRKECIDLLTEIEARLDFEDEMAPLDVGLLVNKINSMSRDVKCALETANYDNLLQSGLQVRNSLNYTCPLVRFSFLRAFEYCTDSYRWTT